jgi:CPA1 family monovalent cation:H+ antiporter
VTESNLIALSAISAIAVSCHWVAWRLKLPAILFLLLAGIIAGPTLNWLKPDLLFGDLLHPFISLSVAIILFEGGMTLKLEEIKGLEQVVRRLITIGLLSTWLVIAVATHWLVGFSWELSFLFGALVVVTGPTVVVPMLRTVRPNAKISNILRWEGIMIDPIGALLAVLVFEFIISSSHEQIWQHVLLTFGGIILTGVVMGAIAGYALGLILRHYLLPEYLHNLASIAFIFASFTLANHITEESGLLAVTIMGMWLANLKHVHIDEILNFKEHLTILLISGLFIILAARIEFDQIIVLGWSAIGILAVIQFIARPIKVLISTRGSSLKWQEKALLSWIAPRGIVAAAVSAIFALRLEKQGIDDAQLIVPLTFIVIVGTVVLQSTTAGWIARWLKVAEPDANGMLIVGANQVARKIAAALKNQGIKTLLVDRNWPNIKTARMEGLSTYFGSPVSEHAEQYLDLVGLGRMLALSPQPAFNALSAIRYRSEFGRDAVYTLPDSGEVSEKEMIAPAHRGNLLFQQDASYNKLASFIGKGAEVKVTLITEDFSFEAFLNQQDKKIIPLFVLDAKKQLEIFTVRETLHPKPGNQVVSLVLDTVLPDPESD